MSTSTGSRGGRPFTFNRDEAVEIAMRLFWRHGYEGVSVGDLTRAIGVAPPSLYAAFGNKAGLFRAALARYGSGQGTILDPRDLDDASSLVDCVRRLLERIVQGVTDPARERGCMVSSGMVACHPDHAELAHELSAHRDRLRQQLRACVQPWVGEARAPALARYLAAVLQGISIQARDLATADELRDIVNEVVVGLAAQA